MQEFDYSDGTSSTSGASETYSTNTNLLTTVTQTSGDLANINFSTGNVGQLVNVGSNGTVGYGCGGCTSTPGYPSQAPVTISNYAQISSVSLDPSTINLNTNPISSTITVQVFHTDLTSVGDQTITISVGTFSSNPPPPNLTVKYNPTSRTNVVLSGPQGNTPVTFTVSSQGGSGTVIIQANLSAPSTGIAIAQPNPPGSAQAKLTITPN